MEASSRRLKKVSYGDENATFHPSKQASMVATQALQHARAQEAPKLPRRMPLQPLESNIVLSDRSASMKPLPLASRNDTEGTIDMSIGEEELSGSDATIDDEELEPKLPENGEELTEELNIEGFDDEQLLHEKHEHTTSFADDEADEDDEVKLRLALMEQPTAPCNPEALFPIETRQSRIMLNKCAQIVAASPGILDNEDEDTWDASMVLEYSEDIFRHLRVMELRLLPNKGYMAHQKELNWTFRTVLIDWLVKIHFRFNLLPETLFLCVNYVDRFLSVKEVSLSRLQLVGAVALFVAAKFEEINYLSVQEVSQMVENLYSVDEILKAERYMIDLLDFNLGYPGPMSFLRRVSKADDYELETRTLAKYILEITLMDHRFVAAPPSWCSAIAHYMSRFMLRQGPWSSRHIYFSTYTEEQLMPGVAAIRTTLEDPQMHHQAVFEKYSERKFRKAALFVRNWVQLTKERPDVDFPLH